MSFGRVISVHKRRLGTSVTSTVTGDGTTKVIPVNAQAVQFDEDGGQLVHQPTGDVYDYDTVDSDLETITLSAGLPVGKTFTAEDTLLVYPKTDDHYAKVAVDDVPTDVVSVRLTESVRQQIEEGGRELEKGDALRIVAGDEEWQGTEVLGQTGAGFVTAGFLAPYAGTASSGVLLEGGWLYCDGASISRAQYPNLFNVIGTQYGSASGTTFNLPDLRGRAVFGASSVFALADNEGAAQADRGPAHIHNISADGVHNHGGNTGGNNAAAVDRASGGLGTAAQGHTHSMPDGGSHNHGGDTGPGTGSTNRLGYIALNWLIKV